MARSRSQSMRQARFVRAVAGAVAAVALGCWMAALPARADSPMYRGGAGLTGAFDAKLSLPLALSWKYTATYAGNNPSSPAVAGNAAYFACGDRVYAVDLESGALKWRYPQDQPMSTRVRTSPAVSGNMVYFGAEDGKLYALNTETGKGSWLFDTRSSVSSSPSVVDGIIYFGSADGHVWAIDSRTGAEVSAWAKGFAAGDEVSGAPAVANGMVFALSGDGVLHAVGAATGKQRAAARLAGSVAGMVPMAMGDYVYAAAGSQVAAFLGRNLMRRWTTMMPADVAVTPAVDENAMYVVTTENRIYALDLRNGRGKWKAAAEVDYDVIAPPSVCGNLLFVVTVQGGIYAFDTGTGALKWIYSMKPSSSREDVITKYTNIAAPPVIADGALLVLADDGSLAAFKSDAIDTLPPTVSDIEPAMGVVINGEPPIRFEAKIEDPGSGIDPSSVRLMIDGEGVTRRPDGDDSEDKPGYKYDVVTSTLTYDTPVPAGASTVRPMTDGRHIVTVVARDWAGNTATKTWTVTVDNSVARVARTRTQDRNTGRAGRAGRGRGGIGGVGGTGGAGGIGGRRGSGGGRGRLGGGSSY